MQARLTQEGEVVVVHLSGRLDVETAEPFREACLKRLFGQKVVFDLRELSFVGSSGILPWLETMQSFAARNAHAFKLSGVSSEFRRVFSATPLATIEVYDSEAHAVQAFLNPQIGVVQAAPLVENGATPGSDGKTFEYLSYRETPIEPVAITSECDEVEDDGDLSGTAS